MTKHDKSRRAFIIGAGAAASAALVNEAAAQTHDHAAQASAAPAVPAASARGIEPLPPGTHHGAFFNDEDAATVDALAERIMPGAPGKPGARQAGVLNYIDLALSGAYASEQEFYRHGLTALDAYCRKSHNAAFVRLPPAQQDEVIAALESGKATEFTWPSAREFFETLRTHTMEGMFADPVYGGNRDFAGWTLVGFPGVQMSFTEADMKSRNAFTRVPVTGLQARKTRKG